MSIAEANGGKVERVVKTLWVGIERTVRLGDIYGPLPKKWTPKLV